MKLIVVYILNFALLLCWAKASDKPNPGVIRVLPRNLSKSEDNAFEIEITPTNGACKHI